MQTTHQEKEEDNGKTKAPRLYRAREFRIRGVKPNSQNEDEYTSHWGFPHALLARLNERHTAVDHADMVFCLDRRPGMVYEQWCLDICEPMKYTRTSFESLVDALEHLKEKMDRKCRCKLEDEFPIPTVWYAAMQKRAELKRVRAHANELINELRQLKRGAVAEIKAECDEKVTQIRMEKGLYVPGQE